MSTIVPEVVDRVTTLIAEIDPDKLNDREVIAYLAGISETASGMLKLKPDLKAHADLVMDLANRVFHANQAAEARGYDRAVAKLRDDEAYLRWCRERNFAPLAAADRAEFAEFAEFVKETR